MTKGVKMKNRFDRAKSLSLDFYRSYRAELDFLYFTVTFVVLMNLAKYSLQVLPTGCPGDLLLYSIGAALLGYFAAMGGMLVFFVRWGRRWLPEIFSDEK
jgi:hypothetical protein